MPLPLPSLREAFARGRMVLTSLSLDDILDSCFPGRLLSVKFIHHLVEINNLPTLPEIVLRIQELIMSEEGNATLLARIIEQDPSLTAKILKVANSSFYCGTNGKVSSINLAITRIGFNEIGHIALAVNLIRQFSHKSNVLDYKKFWKHALTSACLCRKMAESDTKGRFSVSDQHTLFLAGLLHDIGILLYDQFFHKEFERIIEHAVRKEIPFLVAEQETVPAEMHGILGSSLLDLWKIDRTIVAAVHFHHAPDKASENYRVFSSVTYLAELFLCNNVLGSFEGTMEPRGQNALEYLEFSHDMMIDLLQRAQQEVDASELALAMENDQNLSHLKAI